MARHRRRVLVAALTSVVMLLLVAPAARAAQPSFLHVQGQVIGETVQVRLALYDRLSRPIPAQRVTVSGPAGQTSVTTGNDGWASAALPLGQRARGGALTISAHFAGNQRFGATRASARVVGGQALAAPQQTQSSDPGAGADQPGTAPSSGPNTTDTARPTTTITAQPSTTTAFPGDAIVVTGQLLARDGDPIQDAMIGVAVGGVRAKGMDLTDTQGRFETRASIPVSEGPGPITITVSFTGTQGLDGAETSFQVEVKAMASPTESSEPPSLDPTQTDTSVPSQEPETSAAQSAAPAQPATQQGSPGGLGDTLVLVGGVGALALFSALVVGLALNRRGRRGSTEHLPEQAGDLFEGPLPDADPGAEPGAGAFDHRAAAPDYQGLDETQVHDPWDQDSGWQAPPRRGAPE